MRLSGRLGSVSINSGSVWIDTLHRFSLSTTLTVTHVHTHIRFSAQLGSLIGLPHFLLHIISPLVCSARQSSRPLHAVSVVCAIAAVRSRVAYILCDHRRQYIGECVVPKAVDIEEIDDLRRKASSDFPRLGYAHSDLDVCLPSDGHADSSSSSRGGFVLVGNPVSPSAFLVDVWSQAKPSDLWIIVAERYFSDRSECQRRCYLLDCPAFPLCPLTVSSHSTLSHSPFFSVMHVCSPLSLCLSSGEKKKTSAGHEIL